MRSKVGAIIAMRSKVKLVVRSDPNYGELWRQLKIYGLPRGMMDRQPTYTLLNLYNDKKLRKNGQEIEGSYSIKKSQSVAHYPGLSQFPDSEPTVSRRSQIPMRTDPERPGPMTFTWVTTTQGKNNTQLLQGLLDMWSQLILTSRYPKCYYTLIITCVLNNGVAQVQFIMGLLDPQASPRGRHCLEPTWFLSKLLFQGSTPRKFFFIKSHLRSLLPKGVLFYTFS